MLRAAKRCAAVLALLLLAVSSLSAGATGVSRPQRDQVGQLGWWDALVSIFAKLRGDMDPNGGLGGPPPAPANAGLPPAGSDLGGDMDPNG